MRNVGALRKPRKAWIVTVALMLSLATGASAAAAPMESELFAVEAPAVMLLEASTGTVIFEKNADDPLPVASIMKEMSLLLFFDAIREGRLKLTDSVTVSKNAAGVGGSQALLDADYAYPVEVLIRSVIVASANDATIALAEHVYGSEAAFVEKMNQKAQQMGLQDTVFKNVTGLPAEGQHTTARDVAAMSRALLDVPEFTQWSTIWTTQITHKNGRITDLVNTNRLIRFYQGADGVKTGSTNEAKNCIAASAERDGLHLIAIVLGAEKSKDRFDIATRLLDYGFDHYVMVDVFKKGDLIEAAIPVRGGGLGSVDLVAGSDVSVMVRKGDEKNITADGLVPESLKAPLDGKPVAELTIYVGDEPICVVEVVPAQAVDTPGFFEAVARILGRWMK